MRMMQPKLFFCVSMETCLNSNLMLVELPSISMSTGIYAVHVRESDQEEFRDDSGIAEGTKNCLEKKGFVFVLGACASSSSSRSCAIPIPTSPAGVSSSVEADLLAILVTEYVGKSYLSIL